MSTTTSAQLLSTLHTFEKANKDPLLRETLSDPHQIITDGFSSQTDFDVVAADLRAEKAERLEFRDVALEWAPAPIRNQKACRANIRAIRKMR